VAPPSVQVASIIPANWKKRKIEQNTTRNGRNGRRPAIFEILEECLIYQPLIRSAGYWKERERERKIEREKRNSPK